MEPLGGAGPERRGLGWPRWRVAEKQRSPIHPSRGMASPRELTQNPLKKIWMPYSNGRPALHASQRGGKTGVLKERREVNPDGWVDGLDEGLEWKGRRLVEKRAQVRLL